MKKKNILFRIIALVLVVVIAYSGYQVWLIVDNNAKEANMHKQLLLYKPALSSGAEGVASLSAPVPKVNPQIKGLQAKYPDAMGWLMVPGTNIDYPFARARDNDFYLHRDLNKRPLFAGTLFMDYRNSDDFSDFNTVIYGHHMKNRSMFGDLQEFSTKKFFDTHKAGTIVLVNKTYQINFFAFAVIKPNDANIYDPTIKTEVDKAAFLSHVKSAARYYRELGVGTKDQIVTLSTCNYEFNNARMVLVGTLTAQ
ncbi:MAG: class B sortase [Coriobacteriia bacterium]|nr:class B sortase [Coriobacteriia bacterium]